ncbi:hypothetical protein [Paractinoplanes brasiliensis]|uniref:Uncharacterized protein n=1 Tax=Paractinoplanes brasiliensis TaxID=52695 RepID=A0A4R6JTR9_9ACTN|nr:hypothetical protein [Actinoplanes brasiliensis]TDO39527.1 hypothetical protein C8E87_3218 [Actinoplanes brasiliensis]GID29134.1 hypothetical protein Abr02nite_41170 [Actinoplanes brasiliensis]
MDPHELRKQVMRKTRYGLNVVALERDLVPPEGPLDVALTNGLAAIVASEFPGEERDSKGRMYAASKLLEILEGKGKNFDFTTLREILEITQPLRHARADDEWIPLYRRHLKALTDLDDEPALQALSLARQASGVESLLRQLYENAAMDAADRQGLLPDEDFQPQVEFESCDECGRSTFLPSGFDDYGGTSTVGQCFACGYERDAETAGEMAVNTLWDQRYEKS